MTDSPSDPSRGVTEETEQTYCYAHTDTPTRLRCTRCDRPICGRCAIPASVGQHCPECVAEARRAAPKIRSTMTATAPGIVALVAVNVVLFIGQRLPLELTQRFAAFPPAIAGGEWYRLVTAMFLHSPTVFFHILFNMLVLWIYGPYVEKAFGTARFLAMYFIAGFFASATSYTFGSCVGSLGASGAIFGVVGILLVYAYNRRTSAYVREFMRGLLVFVGINAVLGFIIPNVDWIAHLGGLMAGIALGAGFDRPSGATPAARQIATALAVGGLGVLLVVARTASFTCAGIGFFS
ncbi:MAG: rhomboid family intramembrane serine protease [Actinomycetota bacterium]